MSAIPPLNAEQRQILLTEDAALIGKPYDVTDNPRAIQAHTRHMARMLGDNRQSLRASATAAFATQMIDTLLAHDVSGPVACGKGCAWCCTTYVSVTIPEVFNLARAVRQSPAALQRVGAAAARAKATPQDLREAQRIVCPILENNGCSLYPSRPLICRSVLSSSLEACLQILVENRPVAMPHAPKSSSIRTFTMLMMKAALVLRQLPHEHYELIQALDVALASDDTEERWLAGEPLFAHVPKDKAEGGDSSRLFTMVSILADTVRPTL